MRRITQYTFLTFIYLSMAFFSLPSMGSESTLPAACSTDCKSTYGKVLGVGLGNVPAYSNCNSACVVMSPNKFKGTYTGIKWQCVEYARRWLLVNKGVVYGDVDVAADIWGLKDVTRVKDKKKFKMMTYANGNKIRPQVGDLLIYAKAYLKTGHVAVISKVDRKSHKVNVIEENYNNAKWPGNYARSIPYIVRDKKYWLLDSYLLGWKHVTQQSMTAVK